MIYYVNGETGLDTNDGLTPESAFKTINKARLECDDINGDTIYVEGKKLNETQIVYDEVFYGGKSDYPNTVAYIVDNISTPVFFIDKTIKYIGLNNPMVKNSGTSPTINIANGFGNFYCKSISFSNLDNSVSALCTFQSYGYDMIFDDCIFEHNTRFKAGNSNGIYVFYNCKFYPTEDDLFLDVGLYKSEVYYINCSSSKRLIFSGGGYRYQNIINSFTEYGCHCLDSTLSTNTGIGIDVEFRLVNNSANNYIYCNFKNGYVVESNSKNLYFLNCNILNKTELEYSNNFIFKNCIISANTFECSMINCNYPEFENCIFTGNKPVDIPDENFINCVFNTDPLLDSEFKPQYNSPCLPLNWAGENPIDTFIGRYDFYEEPSISNLIVSGDKDKIDISFTAVGSDIANTILKFSFDNETWFDTTLLDENKFVKSSYLGTVNTFTWKSKQDFLSDEIVFIEVQIHDDKNYSNILSTSTMVYNKPILLIEPDIMDITTNGTKGDIEISLNVFDEYSIVSGMLQYYDNSIWNNCTLKYGNGYFSASEIGEENTVLWDSYLDFQDDLTTKVRCSVTDKDGLSSGWVKSPTFTIKNLYIEPIISSINTIGTAQDIKITYIVEDDDTEIIESEFQYLNGSDWFSCTIDYNIGLASKSSPEGVFNTVLWKSEIDVQEDITTKIRIRVFDSEWSSWYESGDILIQNGNIPPDMLYYSPLKFKLEDDKKLYFKLKKE